MKLSILHSCRALCATTLAAGLLLLGGMTQASAAPPLLDLTLQKPDVQSDLAFVQYDTTTLVASGYANEISYADGTVEDIDNGTFLLLAGITTAGELQGGGLTIEGKTPTQDDTGILLKGTLTQLGFTDGLIEFLFDPTGGDLMDDYAGRTGGIIMTLPDFTGFG